jgi:alkylated DNA repair dioxygenase AlkB
MARSSAAASPHRDPAPAQGSLFASGPVEVRPAPAFDRVDLGGGAWVDVARCWLGGADDLCARLVEVVDWQHHRRWMYDRVVDDPRLSRWYRSTDQVPDEALAWFRVAVGRHYGVGFGAIGLNYYRDGRDSVAPHADRELRDLDDTLVAILTLGAARPFLLRRQGGGRAIDLHPASGDLLVMGGTCQATWEHAVPKVAAGAGPRISASIRWARGAGAEQEWAPPDRQKRAPADQPKPAPADQPKRASSGRKKRAPADQAETE